MKFIQKYQTFFLLLLCLLLAFFNLNLKLNVTHAWFDGTLSSNHDLLMHFKYTNHEQSRLLQFLIPELFHQVFSIRIEYAYIIQRILFTTLTFFFFYRMTRKWLSPGLGLLALGILALYIMPMTYKNDLQESGPLLSLTFLGCLWMIDARKDLAFLLILTLGVINNETMMFVPLIWFLYNCHRTSPGEIFKVAGKTLLLAAPAIVALGVIRYINIDRPVLGTAFHWYQNLVGIKKPLILYNLMWILPWLTFRTLPRILKISLLTVPLYFLIHMLTGAIDETRQMIPLAVILIPASVLAVRRMVKGSSKLVD